MKIKDYNQMIGYMTKKGTPEQIKKAEENNRKYLADRQAKTLKYYGLDKPLLAKTTSPAEQQMIKVARQPNYNGRLFQQMVKNDEAEYKKQQELERSYPDYIDQTLHMFEGSPLSEKNKKINAALKNGGKVKDPYFDTPSAKNKKNFEKNIKVAMSETPEEETEMMLGGEAVEFLKWLKEHPDSTYNDWLKDTKAELTEEQKKDKKIIDLVPFLPSFKEELDKMEEEIDKEETLKQYMERKEREYKTAQKNGGLTSILLL